MKEDKAREYMDLALSTLEFSGSNGSYYMDIDFPELPDGYKFLLTTKVVYKGGLNRPVWYAMTNSPKEASKIENTGSVHKRIDTMTSVNDILYVSI